MNEVQRTKSDEDDGGTETDKQTMESKRREHWWNKVFFVLLHFVLFLSFPLSSSSFKAKLNAIQWGWFWIWIWIKDSELVYALRSTLYILDCTARKHLNCLVSLLSLLLIWRRRQNAEYRIQNGWEQETECQRVKV